MPINKQRIIVVIACNTDSTTNKFNLPKYISKEVYFVFVLVPGESIAQAIIAPTHMDNTI